MLTLLKLKLKIPEYVTKRYNKYPALKILELKHYVLRKPYKRLVVVNSPEIINYICFNLISHTFIKQNHLFLF